MCGIAGAVALARDAQLAAADVGAMNALLAHRGPDDSGLIEFPRAVLAMRRLSIIDLAGGHQPLVNESGDIALVCNGEIYNFIELRAALQSQGHRFRTSSDAETLIHLYEEHGLEFLNEVDGMFGFALWDETKQRLVLGRDRMGEKPLHIARRDGLVLFASEIKSLLAHPAVPRTPDWSALRLYLRHNYVPAPRTAWAGIEELPAAHLCVVERGAVVIRPYWEWPPSEGRLVRPRAEVLEALEATLMRSVQLRLRSDVPVGLFLSGGIDSSLVAALARKVSEQEVIDSFGLSFPGSRWDESQFQREAATQLGTRHHDVPMQPEGFLSLCGVVLRHLDEPFGDTSMLSTYVLSQYAAQHVKVVLTGDGGDELFGGYDHYLGVLGRPSATESFPTQWGVWSKNEIGALVTGSLRTGADEDPVDAMFDDVRGLSALEQALAFDRRSLLNDNNLVKPDRTGMAHGLEARCPLLSHHLAELVVGVPPDTLLDGGRTKSLLRDIAGPLYGPGFFDRPKGMFTVPLGDWLRTSLRVEGTALVEALIDRGLVAGGLARRMMREHVEGTTNHTRRLRTLIMMELWFQACVDGR